MARAEKGEVVYIVPGHRKLVLQPVAEIERIPVLPPGYFEGLLRRRGCRGQSPGQSLGASRSERPGMKQWEIWTFPFDKERRHPAVIISNDET